MPNFEAHQSDENLAAQKMNLGDFAAQAQRDLDKMRSDHDTLQARLAKAPEAARGAMQSGIDALKAKIVQYEQFVSGFETKKPTSNSEATAARVESIRSRLDAVRQKPSVMLSPELQVAKARAEFSEQEAKLQQEYDQRPTSEVTMRGQSLPDLKRAA